MNSDFKTTLTGNDIYIIGHTLTKNQNIKSVKCNLDWSINPIGGNGIKFWNERVHSFEVEMVIKNTKTKEEECIKFDSEHNDYNFSIDMAGYKRKNRLMITGVIIDKNKKTVVAITNRSVQ